MKKLILFLLLPLWAMAQTATGQEQEFDYGIKNNSTQTITTPPYLGTFGTDGTQGKIPSAYIEKTDNKQNSLAVDGTGTKYPTVDAVNAALPKTYTTTVYVETNDPNIATIFDDENPPTVNDDGLKSNTDNLYIGLDASAWVYSGGEYVTKIIPASSNFYIYSTSIDAGNNKSSTIERFGEIVSKSGNVVRRDGSDSVGGGGYFSFYNNAITSGNTLQLNASNGVDLWNYSSGTWNKRFTFSSDGDLTANSFIKSGGTSSQFLKADGSVDSTPYQPTLVSGTTIKTINGTSLLGSGDITVSAGGGGDMVLASAQTNTGLKTFLNETLGLRNSANTFTSFFTNANTASRTYTLQNRDGILLDNTDLTSINASIATKMANPAGTANYLSKFLTATTIGLSRLWDTGTFFGIGTSNTPTKDLTFGNQADREIGVEDSMNTVAGRSLKIKAGRTLNYVPNTNFNVYQSDSNSANAQIVTAPNGDIYVMYIGSGWLKKPFSSSVFVTEPSLKWASSMVFNAAGDMYVINSGEIWKKVVGGTLTNTGVVITGGTKLASVSNNIYVFSSAGVYVQVNSTGAFSLIQATVFNCGYGINGDVYAISANYLWKQTGGTGLFVNTGIASPAGIASQMTITPSNNLYVAINWTGLFKQTNLTGAFTNLGYALNQEGVASDLSGNVYLTIYGTGICYQNNNVLGTANLDGGSYKVYAGTGKGTGKSRIEWYTGQKLASGTDMQVETLREYIDENGYHIYVSIPSYANDADADADANLPSGAAYKLTGNRTIFHKP